MSPRLILQSVSPKTLEYIDNGIADRRSREVLRKMAKRFGGRYALDF